jgi:hypothetical protein
VPAVPIRRSVQHDHVVCLECGFLSQMLRRHIRTLMASNPRGIASAGSCQRITRSPRRPIRSGVRRWQSGSVLVANRRKPSCRLPKWSQHPQSGVAANRDRQPRSSLRAAARSEHRKPSGLYPVASVLYTLQQFPSPICGDSQCCQLMVVS